VQGQLSRNEVKLKVKKSYKT